jgi:hypothetical protein
MTGMLAGAGGLILILIASGLAVIADAPVGPTGWRINGPLRKVLLSLTVAVVALAVVATWIRLHP